MVVTAGIADFRWLVASDYVSEAQTVGGRSVAHTDDSVGLSTVWRLPRASASAIASHDAMQHPTKRL